MEEQNESTVPKTPRPRCKNCGTKFSKQGNFCPACGQRDFDGRVKMRDLLAKFFANITHLDNKFVKMCWQLFIPARVTIDYFQGKIKRYPHPVQFFFIVMFFFLLIFSKKMEDSALNLLGGSISVGTETSFTVEGKTVSRSNLYASLERCMAAKEYRLAYDSLPAPLRNESAQKALDSIHRKVSEPWEQATQSMLNSLSEGTHVVPSNLDSITLDLSGAKVRIATADFVGLEPDSIIKKYGYNSWQEKVLVKQGIKSIKDQRGLINRCVGSLGWTILMLIAVMALVLRLLYWKRAGYYVEHFIFLMHQQAGIFLFLTLALVVNDYVFTFEWEWLLVLGWMLISPLFAMKRFYGNNWGWTIAKWLVYSAIYWVGLITFFIATIVVVFAIF